jgi:hypothetical protein
MSDSEYLRYRARRFRHLAWLTSHPAAKAELEAMAREYEERASELAGPPADAAADRVGGRPPSGDQALSKRSVLSSRGTAQGQ